MAWSPRCAALGVAAAALLAAGCANGCRSREAAPLAPELISRNNVGVGLMGRFDFDGAAREFRALAEERPEWTEARVNLAVALTNRQGEGDEAEAERLLVDVLRGPDPPLRARYVLGLLRLHAGRPADALPEFEAVAAERPDEAFAAYFAGQCLLQLERPAEALDWYRRTTAADPRLRSAWYGAFLALRSLGRADEAQPMLTRFEELERSPQAMTAEFKYTRMGPLAEAATVDLDRRPPPSPPSGSRFAGSAPLAPEAAWREQAGSGRPASITAADINGDGHLDLFVAGALPGGKNAVIAGGPDGRWTLDAAHPLASVTDVNAALWGDYDDDGHVDVYLCRRTGSNQLWRQESPGRWRDVTREARAGTRGLDTVDGAMVDADHDGDLDLWLVNAAGPTELLNNNGDGTFRPIGRQAGVAGDGRPGRSLVVTDLDGDRDADVIIVKAAPPHDVFVNDRVWSYRPAAGMERFAAALIAAAVAGDRDADGRHEIYTSGSSGLERWTARAGGVWEAELLVPAGDTAGGQLALADTDGDGGLDLLATVGSSWAVFDLQPGAGQLRPVFEAPESGVTAWAAVTLGATGGPSVVALTASGQPRIWPPGPGRHDFVTLAFTGADTRSDQRRSNVSGIGARVALRVDSRWTAFETYRHHSGPGQSHQPVAIGLGGARRADFVAVTWPDGVYQTELELTPGAVHRIAETQRQLSSCPVLFAYDGSGFAFVTDLLGVGGIGFFERPGVYGEPFPRENILLPVPGPVPKDGRYLFKIGEPMEEVGYLDAVGLTAYDLPPGWRMTLDERKALVAPMPTGAPRFYRVEWLPARAVNDRGEDVTAVLRDADLRAAPPGRPDSRFIGLTAAHAVTLAFDEPIGGGPEPPLLVADGWIEYPYAQTVFAAWQAGVAYRAPTIEARGADGRWRTVLPEFGYPAGMPRQMSVPLTGLPRGTREIRLSTTQEIYWDRLAVVQPETPGGVRRTALPLRAAILQEAGFARRTTGPQRVPRYDYNRRAPLWDTRHQRGYYTTFGAVDELVAHEDAAVAIFGPGEEVHLEFDAGLPELPPGWSRRLVLETRGWAKDMDLYTQHGETVEPLPGDATPERARLHPKYNTRYDVGR